MTITATEQETQAVRRLIRVLNKPPRWSNGYKQIKLTDIRVMILILVILVPRTRKAGQTSVSTEDMNPVVVVSKLHSHFMFLQAENCSMLPNDSNKEHVL